MKYVGESVLLEDAIHKNEIVNRHLKKTLSSNDTSSKARISEINNDSFRDKQELVSKLIYIVYFILFSIGLGISVITGMITFRTLNILFIVSLVVLAMALMRRKSFWKLYGDLSMKTAKGVTKDFISVAGPVKRCPKRCRKKTYENYKNQFSDLVN